MKDWIAVLGEAVERMYGSPAKFVFTTSVSLSGERRAVLAYEIQMHGRTSLCFAWNEPTAQNHPCIVLRTNEFPTATDAVFAVAGSKSLHSQSRSRGT
jgi:hypothetical protein